MTTDRSSPMRPVMELFGSMAPLADNLLNRVGGAQIQKRQVSSEVMRTDESKNGVDVTITPCPKADLVAPNPNPDPKTNYGMPGPSQ